MLHDGLYEQIINKGLETELSTTDKLSTTAPIDSAEASKVLAKYIAEVVEKGLDNVADNGGDVSSQVALANRIISTIIHETKEDELDEMTVAERAEQLLSNIKRYYETGVKSSFGEQLVEFGYPIDAIRRIEKEHSKVLGIAISSAYELMQEKDFPTFKVGSRKLVEKEKFRRWVDEHSGGGK